MWRREGALGLSLLSLTAGLIVLRGPTPASVEPSHEAGAPDALALATAAHVGDGDLDQEIRRWQERARSDRQTGPALERLGWAFVAKARGGGDPGFYRLAEQSALAMEERGEGGAAAWLLRGSALHNLHRFEEAEAIARALVEERGLASDHGLLGDVLYDRGAVAEAAESYQQMMDLRPDARAYARAAQLRFLRGDVEGAQIAMETAARAASPRNASSFAWIWSKLAEYQLQRGAFTQAHQSAELALRGAADSAVALFVLGRILLAEGRFDGALEPLSRAATSCPQPDMLWALAEALRASDRAAEAETVEARLLEVGAATDPRGFALVLATLRRDTDRALALAARELAARADVYTFEALAWAQAAAGRLDDARTNIRRALSEGTADARLFYHAGMIAAESGAHEEAAAWFARASPLRHMLLPSQRRELEGRTLSEPLVDEEPHRSEGSRTSTPEKVT